MLQQLAGQPRQHEAPHLAAAAGALALPLQEPPPPAAGLILRQGAGQEAHGVGGLLFLLQEPLWVGGAGVVGTERSMSTQLHTPHAPPTSPYPNPCASPAALCALCSRGLP